MASRRASRGRDGRPLVPRVRHDPRTAALHAGPPGRGDPEGPPRSQRASHLDRGCPRLFRVHGAAFILFGILAAILLAATEREPMLMLAVFVMFTCFEVFFFGLVKVVDEALLRSLGWWTIFVGNLLAATAMLEYFRARHPSLGTRVRAQWALEHRPHQPHEG